MKYNNKIGVIRSLQLFFAEGDEQNLELLQEAGVETFQIKCNDLTFMTEEKAEELLKKLDGRFTVTSVWGTWLTGPSKNMWNFVDGPDALGLVPESYRGLRLENLKKGVDYAALLGVHDFATHAGFIPESPSYNGYRGVIVALKNLTDYCQSKDMYFNFETGQETPVTMMRAIQDMGYENVGVNLDPANLIMYGRGNPIDAIDIYGSRIRGVHVKDGDYPKDDFYKLGNERVVGEGTVNYPVFLPKLLKSGYKGDLYIEREIMGPQQLEDIKKTIKYIKKLMQEAE